MTKANTSYSVWLAILGLLAGRTLNIRQPGALLHFNLFNRGHDVTTAANLIK